MKRYFCWLSILCAGLSLLGCYSSSFFRFSPVLEGRQRFIWVEGQAVALSQDSTTAVAVSGFVQDVNEIIFELVVTNTGDSAVTVFPEDFTAERYWLNKRGEFGGSTMLHIYGPDEYLNLVKEAQSNELLLKGLVGAIDLSLNKPKMTEFEYRQEERDLQRESNETSTTFTYGDALLYKGLLKRNTVLPGHSMGGRIIIQASGEGNLLRLKLPIGQDLHSIVFAPEDQVNRDGKVISLLPIKQ